MNKKEIKKTYQELYKEVEKKISILRDQRRKILDEYAGLACPFKIGEKVSICGYSHSKKTGVVEEIIGIDSYSDDLEWKVIGTVLKKNGEKSLLKFDFTESNYENSKKKEK